MTGAGSQGGGEPWIESREGGWFFVNALLVAPEMVVLFPLTLRTLVGFLVPQREPSPFLDTIPYVASWSLPWLGWLLVIPLWTVWKNLRLERRTLPRAALLLFGAIHLAFLGYTVWRWVG